MSQFRIEANQLLQLSREHLLKVKAGETFSNHRDAVFGAMRSVLGGAVLNGVPELVKQMSALEVALQNIEVLPNLNESILSMMVDAIDEAVPILNGASYDSGRWSQITESISKISSESLKHEQHSLGHIAVVDDEEDILDILEEVLVKAGFTVVKFIKPAELLEYLKSNVVNMVFSDYNMPVLNGLELADRIYADYPDVPIVMVSGFLKANTVFKNIFAVISKPFDFDFIVQAAIHGTKRNQMSKLVERTFDLMMYQYADLDEYLQATGKGETRKFISQELRKLVEIRNVIRSLVKKEGSLVHGDH